MSEHDLDLLDDFVFEPNGWDMATDMWIRVDPQTDREALDELADAMLVWADEPVLERLTDDALDRIWDDELQTMIRAGLVRLSRRNRCPRARTTTTTSGLWSTRRLSPRRCVQS